MSKQIEQNFTFKLDSSNVSVRARSYNSPMLSIQHAGKFADVPISTVELRKLAEYLNSTADTIDADSDFQNK